MIKKVKKFIKLPQNSKARVLAIVVVAIVVIAVIAGLIFRHNKDEVADLGPTQLNSIPDNIQTEPGSGNMSKEYMQALLHQDNIDSTNALKQGTSSLPPMINNGEGYVNTNSFSSVNQDCPCCIAKQAANNLLDKLAKEGKISPDTAADLQRLQNQGASVQDYANELQKLVKEGKLTPQQAQALLAAYKQQHQASAGSPTPNSVVDRMLASGQISPATAQELKALNGQHLTPAQYKAALDRLVKEGKITPEQARELMQAYGAHHGSGFGVVDPTLAKMAADGAIDPATAQDLESLSRKNVPVSQYAAELQRLVKAGKLTPEQARQLLAAYKATHNGDGDGSADNTADTSGAFGAAQSDLDQSSSQLDELAKQQAAEQAAAQKQAEEAQKQAQEEQQQMENQQQQQAMQSAISEQAKTLFTSWNAPAPASNVVLQGPNGEGEVAANGQASSGNNASAGGSAGAIPLIKAGTIMFAVLDTAVNSDQPGPVMATIVEGKYKGAKLLGGITQENDRVELQFNMMSMKSWTGTIKMQAVAINPDTARTALASDVNHHYISRYGSLFAASFLQGYANAVQNNGTTVINPSTGTATFSHAEYSPAGRTMVALGQVGQAFGNAAMQNFNRPPTVKVDVGVGLGILFQSDVAKPGFLENNKNSNGSN